MFILNRVQVKKALTGAKMTGDRLVNPPREVLETEGRAANLEAHVPLEEYAPKRWRTYAEVVASGRD